MNKANFATAQDKEQLRVLYHQKLSFNCENYIEYYFNNEYDDDYHYVLKDEENNIICYINRHITSIKLGSKNIQVSVLRNFIYRDKESLYELLLELEDHLNHQELITLIDDKQNIFNTDIYSSANIFEFSGYDFNFHSNLHLFEDVKPDELLECYAAFAKRFNGFELRDLKYFENKLKENIATSSTYLVYKENGKVYGYAHVTKNIVDEIIYFKKDVIDEVLKYLFVNYDFVSIKTSALESLDKVYNCSKKEIVNFKYQINDVDLLCRLYSLNSEEIKTLLETNIFYL